MNRMLPLLAAFLAVVAATARENPAAAPLQPSGRTVFLITGNDYPPICFERPRSAPAAGAAMKPRNLELVPPGRDSQNLQGFAWDAVRAAFHRQGYAIELRALSWREAAERARGEGNAERFGGSTAHRGDFTVNLNWGTDTYFRFHQREYGTHGGELRTALIFPVVHTPERDRAYAYSRHPLFASHMVVYVLAKSALATTAPEALAGRKIGFVKQYSYGDLRHRYTAVKPMEIDNVESGFNLLRSGRLEALFGYERTFDHVLAKNGMRGLFRKLDVGLTLNEHLCGRKDDPNATAAVAAFDAAFDAMEADGTLQRLRVKWFGGAARPVTAPAPTPAPGALAPAPGALPNPAPAPAR